MNQPRHVKRGDTGYDITAYKRALNKYRATPEALAGAGWPVVGVPSAVRSSDYGPAMVEAVAAVKKRHHIRERGIGPLTFKALTPYIDGWGWALLKLARPTCPADPANGHGQVIGVPYQGTHDHPEAWDEMHNWESCNAIDLALPYGTPLVAVCDGTIGQQIGPLNSGNPVLLGNRLHLQTANNEYYYAHLSQLNCRAGQRVKTAQLLGRSGAANGVNHLHFASKHGDPGIVIGQPTSGYRDRGYGG